MYAVDCEYRTVALRHCMVAIHRCCLNTEFEALVQMYESHKVLSQKYGYRFTRTHLCVRSFS